MKYHMRENPIVGKKDTRFKQNCKLPLYFSSGQRLFCSSVIQKDSKKHDETKIEEMKRGK